MMYKELNIVAEVTAAEISTVVGGGIAAGQTLIACPASNGTVALTDCLVYNNRVNDVRPGSIVSDLAHNQ